jgi:hypothetical protein
MATVRGLWSRASQKGTPAGILKRISASLPRSLHHRCVIKRGTSYTWGQWGWANQSSVNNSKATSIAAGGSIHSLAACKFFNSNMLSLSTSTSGKPPQLHESF